MKKVRLLFFAMLCVASQIVYAQNDFTAYTLSNTTFQDGTARSISMGNAMTALGGDLGAINFNPAGVAVYKFSEFGLTPALTTVKTTTDFFGTSYSSNRTNFGLANVGGVFYFPIGGKHALRNINFGFTYNRLSNFSTSTIARNSGNVSDRTYVDHLADFTNDAAARAGMSAEDFSKELDRNSSQDPFRYMGGALWPSVLAWNTSLTNLNAAGTAFEATPQAEINQRFRRKSFGYNGAADLSMGLNFSDIVYLGLNVTVTSVYNKIKDDYSEDGVGVQDFNYMTQRYEQKTTGSGIGAKFGVIVNPAPFLRLGAAVSTPTLYDLTDRARWQMTSSLGTDYNMTLRTPTLEMDYMISTPFKYNVGAALVFPVVALSVDYEGTDYSHMKFHSANSGPDEDYDWGYMNDIIKGAYKRADKIRAGVEINPTPFLSFRAGFQYSNSGVKYIDEKNYIGSLGAGFTAGGFYADLGFSTTLKNNKVLYDGENLLTEYLVSSASKAYKRGNWKLLLTLGFRF